MAFSPEEPDNTSETPKQAVSGPNNGIVSPNTIRKAMSLKPPRLRLKDDPDYVRQMGPAGEEIGVLGHNCGSHCLVHMAGKHQLVSHCACPECHNGEEVTYGAPKDV